MAGLLVLLFLLFGLSAASKDILVGGKSDAWKIPPSSSDFLNQWAERSRFQVGDHLVWKYEGGKDSVLRVGREDYAKCSTSNPIKEYNDGNTKVKLDHPGPFYFISGAKGHCEKGQKLIVVVMTQRDRNTSISNAPSQAPSQNFEGGPAPSPTSTATSLQSCGFLLTLAVFVAMWVF
ncbi:hypothetical protein Lal_00044776 [Lupinus albus]|uniref:Putative cupredoxin n=1 Tax=Lupinus albus TaxID=3870 RepID=A0A6A4NG09_LUPAL|nr:putative cupredoxin [Lupinus albus]KAF1858743.1 hypothetical protein Lal_00044776 [Lupinus albus]